MATTEQIETIRARRVDATARAMMADGVTLTHEEADDLGEEAMGWLRSRLGLRVEETDAGVSCRQVRRGTGTYGIDSDAGNELCSGLQGYNAAREAAQELADERGESVWLYEIGAGDPERANPTAEEVEPS